MIPTRLSHWREEEEEEEEDDMTKYEEGFDAIRISVTVYW